MPVAAAAAAVPPPMIRATPKIDASAFDLVAVESAIDIGFLLAVA
ncbi:MAG TPA: hypothetical protein VMW62_17900 [Chloroflexota bacterium]|nr:hypothetical protein [Chloroflexota bacterium]